MSGVMALPYPPHPEPGLRLLLRFINNSYVPCVFPGTFIVARPPIIFGWDNEGTITALYYAPDVKAVYDILLHEQMLVTEPDIKLMGEGQRTPPHITMQEIYTRIRYEIRNHQVHDLQELYSLYNRENSLPNHAARSNWRRN